MKFISRLTVMWKELLDWGKCLIKEIEGEVVAIIILFPNKKQSIQVFINKKNLYPEWWILLTPISTLPQKKYPKNREFSFIQEDSPKINRKSKKINRNLEVWGKRWQIMELTHGRFNEVNIFS